MNTLNTKSVNDTDKLQFLRTDTVEDFKKNNGVSSIEVLPSAKVPGAFFFAVAGKAAGAVRSGFNPAVGFKSPKISLVRPPMDATGKQGDDFLLLHEEGNGGITPAAIL